MNAKHFQPRSFSDAPTRYKVLSSITRNLSWKFLLTVIVSPPCCALNLAVSLAEILLPRRDVTISTVTPFAFFARSSSVTTSTQLSIRRILEFTHFLASAGPPLAKAAEFNSDQQGSRYRSAELHLLRTLHSCLAERRMSALSWRRTPPDLLWRAGIGCHVFQPCRRQLKKTIRRTELPLRHREAAER